MTNFVFVEIGTTVLGNPVGTQLEAQLGGVGPLTRFNEAPATTSSQRITRIVSGFPFTLLTEYRYSSSNCFRSIQ